MLRFCPNLVFLSLDFCSFLEQPPTSPSFNKILRETHFSRIERLEVGVDKCGEISAVARAKCVSKIHLLAASLLFVFFLVKVTGEVPSNISSLLLLRSTHLRRIHLSRPPVSLLERLLVTGAHRSFGNSKCHMYIVHCAGHLCQLEVFSSPSKELSLTTASLLVAHCPNLVEVRSIDCWGEKEEVARWRREVKEANMIIETGAMLDAAHCYRTEYPRPCFANLSSE